MFGVRFDLLTQISDIETHIVIFILIFRAPHSCQEGLVAEEAPGICHQVVEQAMLRWPEMDFSSLHGNLALIEVNLQVFVNENPPALGMTRRFVSSQDSAYPGSQLPATHRLCYVIVGPKVESPNTVVSLASSSEPAV